eukprot:NODE_121_length_17861_cov_0.498480.p11 type:complete len:189 gc:universal NODE_121_length_17861_cov_0.498480:3547-4113(+)
MAALTLLDLLLIDFAISPSCLSLEKMQKSKFSKRPLRFKSKKFKRRPKIIKSHCYMNNNMMSVLLKNRKFVCKRTIKSKGKLTHFIESTADLTAKKTFFIGSSILDRLPFTPVDLKDDVCTCFVSEGSLKEMNTIHHQLKEHKVNPTELEIFEDIYLDKEDPIDMTKQVKPTKSSLFISKEILDFCCL